MWTLTVSHKQRRLINLKVNELIYKRNPQGIKIEADQQVDRQGFWLMKDQHLVGCTTDAGIVNGQLYRVVETEPPTLQILDTEEIVQLTDPRCVKPAHCLCFYSAQGRTLRGRVRLMISHPKITTTAIIVGLSRATSPELIDTV